MLIWSLVMTHDFDNTYISTLKTFQEFDDYTRRLHIDNAIEGYKH